jgi:hypothetical protein
VSAHLKLTLPDAGSTTVNESVEPDDYAKDIADNVSCVGETYDGFSSHYLPRRFDRRRGLRMTGSDFQFTIAFN